MGYFETDNFIDYNAGPMEISLNAAENYISIKSKIGQGELFDEITNLVTKGWSIENSQIEKFTYKIIIKCNPKILKSYLCERIVYE